MPLKQLMTWQQDKKRWRKFHEGKWYFVSCCQLGTEGTRQASRKAANEWWLKNLYLLKENPKSLPDQTSQPTPAPGTDWLTVFDSWKKQQTINPKSPARIFSNIKMARFFIDFVGAKNSVARLDEKTWLDFSAYIHSLRAEKGIGANYLARIQKTACWLVRFAWETRFLPDLPRNLNQRHLFLQTEKTEIKVFKIRDILAFINHATGQARLHLLLMLNCGFSAVDVSNLQQKEVNWEERSISRKRSKTKSHEGVPTITYPLWPSTYDLLRFYRSGTDTVLLTKAGREWVSKSFDNDKYHHSDSIASNFRRICAAAGVKIYPRGLRATAASNLAQHPIFKFYCEHYLGHSPRSIAASHYVKPCLEEFSQAIFWLGERFGVFDL